ncbi:hypothetical protein Lfu02_59410 [Longispora fulva]|uniref:Uncharacterized protein n=1 Tax=Longispora fulva TaxID=619741 RepID=A0A8J7GI51_9ACTN|nr:hypothetical protein [Longispora fulva]MBG6137077.1 hypothetical protein [Longispora fulva]GIG61569.1 hypothetical protein Lfu02_59410 [Longispora fulva]
MKDNACASTGTEVRAGVNGRVLASPIKEVICLLAALVLDVHRQDAGGLCAGCAVALGEGRTLPCGPVRVAQGALSVVRGG